MSAMVNNIPQGWICSELRLLIVVLTDYTANGSFGDLAANVQYLSKKDYARLVRLTDIRTNFTDDGVWVNKDSYDYLSKSKLFGNEILIANVGAYAGYTFQFKKNFDEFATLGPNMFLVKLKEAFSNTFFYYLFNEAFLFDQLTSKAISSAQPKLNKENVKSCLVRYPESPIEQARIASAMSDIDGLITNLQNLIEKKRNIKQGAMQELLSGKRRLAGYGDEWEETTLDSIASFTKGHGLSKTKLSPSGSYPCVLYGEIFTTYNYELDSCLSKTDYYEGTPSKEGDVIMPSSTTTCGRDLAKAIAINKENILLGGDIIVIRNSFNKYDAYFLASLITELHKSDIEEVAHGTTIVHLRTKNILKLKLSIPKTINEQSEISKVLKDMDREIGVLEERLVKYQALKQGMMQQLLTGKIRLI